MAGLDPTDRRIVALMQEDARRSNKELAAAVGIAPSTCSERVRRLEEAGVLRGYTADVDPTALGIGMRAMLAIRLRRHNASEVDTFRGRALSMPEVIEVAHIETSLMFDHVAKPGLPDLSSGG